MKDKAKPFSGEDINVLAIHGHTKIELTDVATGDVEVYESDNTFQPGVVAKYMRSLGAYNNNPYGNSTWAGQDIWRNLCGGIFLFRDEIDDSNGEVEYMPAGNLMVGNGAYGVVNNGTPVEMGSYNSVESDASGSDSISMVYDFTSAQGNGTISCVCLTSEIGGYIGYGNKSGVAHSTQKSFIANQSGNSFSNIVYKNARYAFGYDFTNSKVIVTRTPTQVSVGSIFDGKSEASYEIAVTGTMPPNWGTVWPFYIKNGKVALFMFDNGGLINYLNVGATYTFVIVDLENDSAQSYTVTNNYTDPLLMHAGYADNMAFGVLAADDTHVYFAVGSDWYPIVGINYLTDQVDYVLDDYSGSARPINRNFQFFSGNLSEGLVGFYTTGGSWILDKTAGTFYPVNGDVSGCNYSDDLDAFLYHVGGGRYTSVLGFYARKNPLYLATINNLDSPVTKTANQTMKVTYTLTKATS